MTEKVDYRKIVAELYDEWAGSYDVDNSFTPYYLHLDNRYLDIIKEHADKLGSEFILDIGCGTGTQTLILAEMGFSVVGIDLSKQSVEVAKAKARSKGVYEKVDFIVCDACNIPIKDKSAGSVVSFGLVLSHILEYERAIEETSRVIRDDGYFIIEFENKWSLGIIYYLLDIITRGRVLGYFQTPRHFSRYMKTGIYEWEYVNNLTGQKKIVPLSTVSIKFLEKVLADKRMILNGVYGVHILTLIVPTRLQEYSRSRFVELFVKTLGKLERLLYKDRFFGKIGNSLIMAGYKG